MVCQLIPEGKVLPVNKPALRYFYRHIHPPSLFFYGSSDNVLYLCKSSIYFRDISHACHCALRLSAQNFLEEVKEAEREMKTTYVAGENGKIQKIGTNLGEELKGILEEN